jgi:hypothetical protein
MLTEERRLGGHPPQRVLQRSLNEDQLETLHALEQVGWTLKFVRKPPCGQPIPVVYDTERRRYAVLRPDGTLDERPGFTIRP